MGIDKYAKGFVAIEMMREMFSNVSEPVSKEVFTVDVEI